MQLVALNRRLVYKPDPKNCGTTSTAIPQMQQPASPEVPLLMLQLSLVPQISKILEAMRSLPSLQSLDQLLLCFKKQSLCHALTSLFQNRVRQLNKAWTDCRTGLSSCFSTLLRGVVSSLNPEVMSRPQANHWKRCIILPVESCST